VVVPLQNRVLPTGEIVADPARGLLMGNRGCIHRPDRTLGVTRWRGKMWICCVLSWRGRHRDVMPPGQYTALFFLDEWFAESWQTAGGLAMRPRAAEMDAVLHAERIEPRTRRQITRPAVAGGLPDGAVISHEGTVGLWCAGSLLPWSLHGYGTPVPLRPQAAVRLLTPAAMVAALTAGYRPLVHPSAGPTPLRSFSGAPVAAALRPD
jgi:hypothetical protein